MPKKNAAAKEGDGKGKRYAIVRLSAVVEVMQETLALLSAVLHLDLCPPCS